MHNGNIESEIPFLGYKKFRNHTRPKSGFLNGKKKGIDGKRNTVHLNLLRIVQII